MCSVIFDQHCPLCTTFQTKATLKCSCNGGLCNSVSYLASHHYYDESTKLYLVQQPVNPLPDDNFKLDENGIKLSKWVENTVGKGEIACYEQFFLFPQCFQKACFRGASKGVIVWE